MHAYEENIQLYENFLPFCKLLNLCNNNVENAWNIFLKERIGVQQCMPLSNITDYVYAIPLCYIQTA
ncbi:hypothetical protein QQG55_3545 [Brugia pahangi]